MSDMILRKREHGSALDQLKNLRDMASRTAAEPAAAAVDAAPVEAFAVGAEAPAAAPAGNAAQATQYVDDPALRAGAAVAGNDPDALARAAQAAAAAGAADPAAQQVVDVAVQPRLIIQGQSGPIVVPVDVAVPAAQTRVSIAPATAVVVDPATGQAIATQATGAAPETVAAAPRQGLRSMSASDIGDLFRGRSGAAAGAPAAAVADSSTSLIDRLRAAAAGRAQVAPAAGEVAPVVTEVAGEAKPSLLGQLRGAAGQLRGTAATGAAADVVTDVVADGAAKAPSLADRALDAFRMASKVNPKG